MKNNLSITIVQTYIYWHDKQRNIENIEGLIQKTETDLIILPEMFTTGFSIDPTGIAEDIEGQTLDWMRTIATRKNAAIAGSIITRRNGQYFNTLLFVKPDGSYAFYDKRHTFSMAGENRFYTKGKRNILINYRGWKIKPLICYDLRFPVWARNKCNYDLLVYVANWPRSRIQQWKALLAARAIENQAYTIGVNRIGTDGNDFDYSGESMILSPKGEIIYQAPADMNDVKTVTLDLEKLKSMRQKFPVLQDMDQFTIRDETQETY